MPSASRWELNTSMILFKISHRASKQVQLLARTEQIRTMLQFSQSQRLKHHSVGLPDLHIMLVLPVSPLKELVLMMGGDTESNL